MWGLTMVNRDLLIELFDQRELTLETSKDAYINAAIKVSTAFESLVQLSNTEFNEAFTAFNKVFHKKIISAEPQSTSFDPRWLDTSKMSEFSEKLQHAKDPYTKNMHGLILRVYTQMNKNFIEYQLCYHQPRHGIEMFRDLSKLISKSTSGFSQMKSMDLITCLCGLFHDSKFTRVRVEDEENSVKEMLEALNPILEELPEKQREIIKNFVYVIIVGGTLPCFLKKSAKNSVVNKPSMESLFELIYPLISTNPFAIPVIITKYLTFMIGQTDVKRTSIPLLADDSIVQNDQWKELGFLFDTVLPENKTSFKEQLAQDLRVLFEIQLKKSNMAIARAALEGQQLLEISQTEIENLVSGLNGSLFFSSLMDVQVESHRDILDDMVEPNRLEYSNLIPVLQQKLTSDGTPAQEKLEIINALIRISSNQTGERITMLQIESCISSILNNTEAPVVTSFLSGIHVPTHDQDALENLSNEYFIYT